MDEHIHALRAELHKLDTHPGTPGEAALAHLTRLQAAASKTTKDARQLPIVTEELTRTKRELEAFKAHHQDRIDRYQNQLAARREQNRRIREEHRQLVGQVGIVIGDLRRSLTVYADQLLDLSNKKTP